MSPIMACPSLDYYERLLAGDSSPGEAEQVAAHLESCARCGDLVGDLIQRDTLVNSLRGADTSISLGQREQQVLGELMPRLRQLASGATNAYTAGARPTANELIDFLAPPQAPDEVGRLGAYRILKVLGSGGMGVVYLAEDTHLKRKVALKAMLPTLASSASARARFLREAQTAAAIEHDHIVPIFQVGEDRGVPFIAMPLLKGMSLDERLTKEPRLTPAEILRIGQETARGLAAAHAEGLIHRDIKPANLWLEGKEGRVKILDFGLARALVDQTQLTQEGNIIGTPAYMAPEQGMGQVVDHRCDLFSLGCVLYRLCTGELPFKGNNTLAILSALAMQNPPAPAALNPAVSAPLSALVMRLLAKDPANRPASAQEVAAALRNIADQSTDESKGITETVAPNPKVAAALDQATPEPTVAFGLAPPRRRRRRVPVLAAVGLFVLLGVGILFGGQIFRIVTNQGELVIAVDDPAVEVKIVQNGVVVHDKTTKRAFTLTAVKGEIEVLEKDGVKLATKQFELARGGKTTVKVTLQELAEARKPKDPVSRDPKVSAAVDRRAAEWVLSIGGNVRITANGKEGNPRTVQELPRGPFELRIIDLTKNGKVTDAGLASLKDCQELTHLFLHASPVSDVGLAHLENCKNLTRLSLNMTEVTAAGIAKFQKALPNCKIESDFASPNDPDRRAAEFALSIGGTIKISEDGKEWQPKAIGDLPRGPFAITELSSNAMTDAGLAFFKDCKKLTALSFEPARISDAGLAHFRFNDWKNLRILNLDGTMVSDAGLAPFKDCKNLTLLGVGKTQVTDAGLALFKDSKNLEVLSLGGSQVTDAGLAHFKDCKNLTRLHLGAEKLTDAGLANFKDCKNLTVLDLGSSKVTDAGLVHFKDCKNLTYLELYATQVSDVGLAHFKDCKNLAYLGLSSARVTDAGLANFKDSKKFARLYLEGTQVSDAGLAHFKDSKNLAALYLNDTRVSDASLADLAALPRTLLHLSNSRVSLRGYEELKAALPKCELTWSEPNRAVAEGVLALGGTVAIGLPGKLESRPIKAAADMPEDYFQVRRVSLAGVAKPLEKLPEQLAFLRMPEFDRLESIDLSGITGLDYGFLVPIHGLRELSLGNPALNDLTLGKLPKLPALKRLSLAGSGLTDAGIKHLAGLTNLEWLNLHNTKVTAAGVAELQKALPKCKIAWDGKKDR